MENSCQLAVYRYSVLKVLTLIIIGNGLSIQGEHTKCVEINHCQYTGKTCTVIAMFIQKTAANTDKVVSRCWDCVYVWKAET